MQNISEVEKIVMSAAERNSTRREASLFLTCIRKYSLDDFANDYNNTKQGVRKSSGKIEKIIFPLLASVFQWRAKKENIEDMSEVMLWLGYKSYERQLRVRQKIENLKKKMKAGQVMTLFKSDGKRVVLSGQPPFIPSPPSLAQITSPVAPLLQNQPDLQDLQDLQDQPDQPGENRPTSLQLDEATTSPTPRRTPRPSIEHTTGEKTQSPNHSVENEFDSSQFTQSSRSQEMNGSILTVEPDFSLEKQQDRQYLRIMELHTNTSIDTNNTP